MFIFNLPTGLKNGEKQISVVKELREMVEDLQQRVRQTYTDLRAKHVRELLLLKKAKSEKLDTRRKDEGNGRSEMEGNEREGHFPTETRMSISRFKRGSKPDTYAHRSVEDYFDQFN